MKKIRYTVLIVCCFAAQVHAQKEGNIWHFGFGFALDFNSGSPQAILPSSMQTFEGCASISDAFGNLQFYTNGGGRDPIQSGQSSGKIWNRNHAVMYDMGNTEGGGFSSAQSSVIIPKPGSPNSYYLFTMEEVEYDIGGSVPSQPLGRGLSYFEVDMNLNSGLGGVSAYTGSVYVPTYEGLCAIRHANGVDYWVIVHQSDESGYAVFPVTATGVGNPALFDVNVVSATSGIIKGAPNGQWLCSGASLGAVLCKFDPATGVVSDPLALNGLDNQEFSPNSQRLFSANSEEVFYFDLTAADIEGSRTVVGTTQNTGLINAQMQLGPDGNIYFLQTSFSFNGVYLSAIVCPNSAPFLDLEIILFGTAPDEQFFGLPNFDNAIFRLDEDPPLAVNLGDVVNICEGQSALLDAGIPGATYDWSNGSTTQTIEVSAPGLYAVTVTSGCGVGVDTVEVLQTGFDLDAGPDISACEGDPVQLNGTGSGTLLWSPEDLIDDPSSATPQFTGNSTAILVLTSTENGCTAQDTVLVTINPLPVAEVQADLTNLVAGESAQLSGSGAGTYLWSPATNLSCTDCPNPVAMPETTTTYLLTITSPLGCTDTASITINVAPPLCDVEFPKAFTPNGDGRNDAFRPLIAQGTYEMVIYNRWGEEVYQGNTPWDGRSKAQSAPSDVYVFKATVRLCEEEKVVVGDVTLLR